MKNSILLFVFKNMTNIINSKEKNDIKLKNMMKGVFL